VIVVNRITNNSSLQIHWRWAYSYVYKVTNREWRYFVAEKCHSVVVKLFRCQLEEQLFTAVADTLLTLCFWQLPTQRSVIRSTAPANSLLWYHSVKIFMCSC